MKRRIIHIEESRCNGCGLCAAACHEGAIEMVNGKARLTREDYCDGLGDCLPACPTGAITFEEREAPAYDHAAVLAAKAARAADTPLPCGCPGSQSRAIRRPEAAPTAGDIPSELRQWPVQIKLAPVNAPYFDGCDLHCCRLHRLRLRRLSPGLYPGPGDPYRLPQAGRRGL